MPAKKLDFATLFKDTKAFPDDFVIKLGDNDVTMGDLRAYDVERGGELQAELQRQQAQLAEDQRKLQTASERVAKTFIDLEREKASLASNGGTHQPSAADPMAAYENDQVFGPMLKYVRSVESTISSNLKQQNEKLETLVKSIGQMGVTYMGDKAASDFKAIMQRDDPVRPANLTLDTLYKLAVEGRHLDRNNLPDLNAAYDTLTRDARHKHELEQARADERTKIERERQEAAMLPMPSIGGNRPPAEAQPVNLNDAINKASQDRELWKTINTPQLIGGGSMQ